MPSSSAARSSARSRNMPDSRTRRRSCISERGAVRRHTMGWAPGTAARYSSSSARCSTTLALDAGSGIVRPHGGEVGEGQEAAVWAFLGVHDGQTVEIDSRVRNACLRQQVRGLVQHRGLACSHRPGDDEQLHRRGHHCVRTPPRTGLAEGVGFEPTIPRGDSGFQDRRHRPLGHPSATSNGLQRPDACRHRTASPLFYQGTGRTRRLSLIAWYNSARPGNGGIGP